MNRDDFPILNINKDLIYLDNGATTLKPKVLLESTNDYYSKYTANAHRGDYDNSLIVDTKYEHARELVRDLIGAKDSREIIFTSGCTDSLNKIIFGYFRHYLKEGDEVLLTKSEHASNILPWFELADEIKCQIKYIPLTSDLKVTIDNVKHSITPKTKVISIAHVTNVAGDIRPIKEITKLAHEHDILVVVDGAQSVPHMPVDVTDLDIDFLAFSAHKMCGPTGVGVLYGKEKFLNNMRPIIFGGGMNASFDHLGYREYVDLPHLFEAGTPNIAGVIAFGEVIKYLKRIGMDKIHKYELELKKYAISKLKQVPNIIIYSENNESGIITFNIKDIFAQDLAIYLNKYKICVRAGNHCAKMLKDELKIKNTCRISLYFYNTKEEIDYLVEVLSNPKISTEII
ncbi:MAG: cysteine desulfurase [Mollicutes bacterium]|nr:cysteine desulfurase [Mollicutes bacterium]